MVNLVGLAGVALVVLPWGQPWWASLEGPTLGVSLGGQAFGVKLLGVKPFGLGSFLGSILVKLNFILKKLENALCSSPKMVDFLEY